MAIALKLGDPVGPYTIVDSSSGFGNFAHSYRASDPGGRKIHLKQYADPTPARSWYREFVDYQDRIASALGKVPGALAPVETFESGGYYYQAFPYLEAKDLQSVLLETWENPSSYPEILRWETAASLCHWLRELHDQGLVVCDLKPANILVDSKTGAFRALIDFDFSFLQGASPPWVPAGMDGRPGYVGTYPYWSPEHSSGGTPTQSSDVFACGVILYELLCAAHPFAGCSDPATCSERVRSGDFPDPASLNTDINPAFANEMKAML